MDVPDTRYAKTPDGVYIAYQVSGEGPVDIVWQFDFIGNVDVIWEHPILGTLFRGLSSFGRLILHDRRGTGLSSRNVPPPNLETRVADLLVVLNAVGCEQPVLVGYGEGGGPNVLLAATEPKRVRSLVWFAPAARVVWTPDYPWGVGPKYVERDQRSLELWGTSEYGQALADTEATVGTRIPEQAIRLEGKLTRHTCTPDVARELSRIWYETDIRGVLPTVQAPTLLLMGRDEESGAAEAEYVASLMPHAELRTLPGGSIPRDEDLDAYLGEVRRFLGVEAPPAGLDTILSTVLFTDIVGSTEKQVALGDRGWRDLVERHHAIVREGLERWHGIENDTAGDGFYATFDGPARAIRCALEVAERVRDLGIEIRAGVHTGECEVIEGKCGGLTVSIGARVASNAGPGEVLVSQTVKDLVAGSGLSFEEHGVHALKGIPDEWGLYAVTG